MTIHGLSCFYAGVKTVNNNSKKHWLVVEVVDNGMTKRKLIYLFLLLQPKNMVVAECSSIILATINS